MMIFLLNRFNTRLINLTFKPRQYIFTSSAVVQKQRDPDFVPVYRLKVIRQFSVLSKAKVYQTGIIAISLPIITGLTEGGLLSKEVLFLMLSFGISSCLPLYGVGYFLNRFIGFVYYNEKKHITKIAYLDFWGRRKDVEIPSKEIIPLSESPTSITDRLYSKVKQYNSKETFKISMNLGEILDKDKFNKVL